MKVPLMDYVQTEWLPAYRALWFALDEADRDGPFVRAAVRDGHSTSAIARATGLPIHRVQELARSPWDRISRRELAVNYSIHGS